MGLGLEFRSESEGGLWRWVLQVRVGRALAKSVSLLRVWWPALQESVHVAKCRMDGVHIHSFIHSSCLRLPLQLLIREVGGTRRNSNLHQPQEMSALGTQDKQSATSWNLAKLQDTLNPEVPPIPTESGLLASPPFLALRGASTRVLVCLCT